VESEHEANRADGVAKASGEAGRRGGQEHDHSEVIRRSGRVVGEDPAAGHPDSAASLEIRPEEPAAEAAQLVLSVVATEKPS
jgi:hypothetical protein